MSRRQQAERVLWEVILEAWGKGDFHGAKAAEAHLSDIEPLTDQLFDLKYPDLTTIHHEEGMRV